MARVIWALILMSAGEPTPVTVYGFPNEKACRDVGAAAVKELGVRGFICLEV